MALRRRCAAGRYAVTDDALACAGFDVAVITVPTPLHEGAPTCPTSSPRPAMLAPLPAAGRDGRAGVDHLPGHDRGAGGADPRGRLRAHAGHRLPVGYSPERIDPGNRDLEPRRTPRRSSPASTPRRSTAVHAFYATIVDRPCRCRHRREAELTKLLENTFRHVNVALVNELAMFARDLGIDIWEAIDAASTKPFGFMRFTPGPGVGGHCLPIDPSYLSWTVRQRLGRPFRFVELANDINDHMPDYVVPPARCGAEPAGVAPSTAARCCCSAWRTSATPATPGSRRRWRGRPADRRRGRGRRGRPSRGRADVDRR